MPGQKVLFTGFTPVPDQDPLTVLVTMPMRFTHGLVVHCGRMVPDNAAELNCATLKLPIEEMPQVLMLME